MKILQIDVNYKHSSTGKIVYDLHQGYQKEGFTSRVLYGRGPLEKDSGVYKFGIDLETYFHALMTRITGLVGFFSPLSTRRLIRFIKKFQPDIIHIHELHAYFVNYAPLLKFIKKHDYQTIWTFHCEHMFTGKCGYSYDCNKFQTQCKKCPQKREYPKSWFFDFSKFMFNHKKKLFNNFNNLVIVTPSEWLARRVKQSFLKNYPIEVINNGINNETIFKPLAYKDLIVKHNIKDELVVLSVAPNLLDQRKGGRRILKIAAQTKNLPIKYILIGVSTPPQNNIQNVIYLPRTYNQIELAKYYSMADIFLITSYMENYPTTCLEALSSGTPIIGYDSGGTKETASLGYGSFFKMHDSKIIIHQLKNTPKKTAIDSLEISNRYLTKNSKASMTKNYLLLLKRINREVS